MRNFITPFSPKIKRSFSYSTQFIQQEGAHKCPGHHSLSCRNLYFFGKAFFSKERFVYNLNIQLFAGFLDNFFRRFRNFPRATPSFDISAIKQKFCRKSVITSKIEKQDFFPAKFPKEARKKDFEYFCIFKFQNGTIKFAKKRFVLTTSSPHKQGIPLIFPYHSEKKAIRTRY